MKPVRLNAQFQMDYERLRRVSLNPRRHTAANALEHTEQVLHRVRELARLNDLSSGQSQLLEKVAVLHDIGKICGTAKPSRSVELLPRYGVTDRLVVDLVANHDVALPWFKASRRGEGPSARAWKKLAGKVDPRLLVLFMIADRVDCPGGWRSNLPTLWFIEEAKRHGFLDGAPVTSDDPEEEADQGLQRCAGGVLVEHRSGGRRALVIRVRADGFEVPKGHIESGERPQEAAVRELVEETNCLSHVVAGTNIGSLEYSFTRDIILVQKRVEYFALRVPSGGAPRFGKRPASTRELRWIGLEEAPLLRLVNEDLRPILMRALA